MSYKIEEIDLHVSAFVQNTSGLYPEDLVQLSLNRMKKYLDEAIAKNKKEIRFIHGLGLGTLKDRVYHELRIYQNEGLIESFEPSFFNRGVVNVIIRY